MTDLEMHIQAARRFRDAVVDMRGSRAVAHLCAAAEAASKRIAELEAARSLLGEVELLIADRRDELREQAQIQGIPTPEPRDDDDDAGYQVFIPHGFWKRIGAAMEGGE